MSLTQREVQELRALCRRVDAGGIAPGWSTQLRPLFDYENSLRFFHFRMARGGVISSKGGITICVRPANKGAQIGAAVCTDRDQYNRRVGRIKAEGYSYGRRHHTLLWLDACTKDYAKMLEVVTRFARHQIDSMGEKYSLRKMIAEGWSLQLPRREVCDGKAKA